MRKHARIVETGLRGFDRTVRGLHSADLVVLAGSPSIGKTALALNIAANVSLGGRNPPGVALFSMAADRNAVMTRLIATQARVNLSVAKTGVFPRSKWQALTDAAAKISDATLYIDDSSIITASRIRSRCEELSDTLRKGGKRLGLVIIDFLQLIHGAQKLKPGVCGKTATRGARIMRQLKLLAVDLRVPVVVMSQLPAAPSGKGQAPTQENSGDYDIPTQADIVAFVRRGPVASKATLFVAKTPRGRTGLIPLKFSKDFASFSG